VIEVLLASKKVRDLTCSCSEMDCQAFHQWPLVAMHKFYHMNLQHF
jgi:hypothetical protein